MNTVTEYLQNTPEWFFVILVVAIVLIEIFGDRPN